jgi:hypothetical protein
MKTDLTTAVEMLEKTMKFLNEYHESGFEQAVIAANELANVMNCEPCFKMKRIRKKKKLEIHEGSDEPFNDAKEEFRITVFKVILDYAQCSVKDRFEMITTVHSKFSFLVTKTDLDRLDQLKKCKELEATLTGEEGDRDIDAIDLADELDALKVVWPSSIEKMPLARLKYLHQHRLTELFPNYCIAMRVLLTLPVTVASGERSFSRLKLLKTYLRSTMCQDRLSNLAILSIENDVTSSLSFTDLINDFAHMKSRKLLIV